MGSVRRVAFLLFLGASLATSGCLPYIYHERERVLIDGLDVDQSLDVAERELSDGGFGSVLTLWALRDQVVSAAQARRIAELYFRHVDAVSREAGFFDLWHMTWAISNLYRLGDSEVRAELEGAYRDASDRVTELDSRVATLHFGDDRIHMGDAHAFGRAFARSRLVAPGNELYRQSAREPR